MLKNTIAILASLGVAAAVATSCAHTQVSERYKLTSVCQAALDFETTHANESTYIEADFISDHREGSLLYDDKCPDILISPFESRNLIKDAAYSKFNTAFYSTALKGGLFKIRIILYGRLTKTSKNNYRFEIVKYL